MDHDEFARALGEKLRSARRRRGMTQAALADAAFSKSFVSQVEHGRIHPSLSSLQHFSRRLGIRLSALLGEPTQLELAAYLTDLALELGQNDEAERLLCYIERHRHDGSESGTESDAPPRGTAVTRRRGALALLRGEWGAASRLLQQAKREGAVTTWWEQAHTLLWEGRLALAEEKPLWAARAWEGCLQLCDQAARAGARAAGDESDGRKGITAHPPWEQPVPLRAKALAHLAELHRTWGEERPSSDHPTGQRPAEERAIEGHATSEHPNEARPNENRPMPGPTRADKGKKEGPARAPSGVEPLVAEARIRVVWAALALYDLETRQAEFWAAQADTLIAALKAKSLKSSPESDMKPDAIGDVPPGAPVPEGSTDDGGNDAHRSQHSDVVTEFRRDDG